MNHLLFEETQIAGHPIRNRVVLPPMSLLGADEAGRATEKMARGYEAFAKGGFGLIITEGLYMDENSSQGAPKQPGLVNEAQAASWKPIVDSVHQNGAVMIAQLAHIGAMGRMHPVAPSAISISEKLPIPRALTAAEIHEIADAFGRAANLAEKTGFDGVEIHGAMGLVQQFLSPVTNRRTDAYGGTMENRMRFLREILAAVRAQTSPSFLVGLRVLEDPAWTLDDLQQFFTALSTQPLDYLHTSEQDALKPTAADPTRSYSALAKATFGRTVIAAGGLGTPERAAQALAHADLISVGKMALANPDWVRKVQDGLPLTAAGNPLA